MRKNTPGFWEIYAFTKDTREPVPGIKATITATIKIDDAAAIPTNTTNPEDGEDDGYYMLPTTSDESNGDQLWLYPSTTTPNVVVIGVPGYIATTLTAHVQGSGAVSFSSLYSMFGESNIRCWADLDNDADDIKIDSRINDAIADTTDEVYDELRGHLDLTNVDGVTGIRRVITRLAGVDLYTRRGLEDDNDAVDKQRKLAYKQLQRIITDLARTGQARVGARHPSVIT